MKIQIIKELPGQVPGKHIISVGEDLILRYKSSTGHSCEFDVRSLILEGFAEEIKDDIDIEEIREERGRKENRMKYNWTQVMSQKERIWFDAYVTVKAVIEKLNGGWEPNWNIHESVNEFAPENENYFIQYSNKRKLFSDTYNYWTKVSLLPECKNSEIAQKVISLCEPELKILFEVK